MVKNRQKHAFIIFERKHNAVQKKTWFATTLTAVHLVFMTQSITITLQCTELQAMREHLDACSDCLYLSVPGLVYPLFTMKCTKPIEIIQQRIYHISLNNVLLYIKSSLEYYPLFFPNYRISLDNVLPYIMSSLE